MNKKIGFIGCGKMASAIIGGCLSSKELSGINIVASEINETARNIAENNLKIKNKYLKNFYIIDKFVLKLLKKDSFFLCKD